MTVVASSRDTDTLSLTIVAEFEAPPERVWDVFSDARLLERWWGPPTFPATFTRHEFRVGGECRYYMTGPAGESPHGYWRIRALEPPRRIEFANGLAGEDGEPMQGVDPMSCEVTIEAAAGRTRMTARSRFVDLAQMEQMLAMGMEEGMSAAIGQLDAVLAAASV